MVAGQGSGVAATFGTSAGLVVVVLGAIVAAAGGLAPAGLPLAEVAFGRAVVVTPEFWVAALVLGVVLGAVVATPVGATVLDAVVVVVPAFAPVAAVVVVAAPALAPAAGV